MPEHSRRVNARKITEGANTFVYSKGEVIVSSAMHLMQYANNLESEVYTQNMADNEEHTIFGRIVRKEIPATFIYEDEQCVVIRDIHPQAPTHLLVISKREIRTLDNISEEEEKLIGHMIFVATRVAKEQNLSNGYRIVINNGKEGGQHVYHLHVHVLGGRHMKWPPG